MVQPGPFFPNYVLTQTVYRQDVFLATTDFPLDGILCLHQPPEPWGGLESHLSIVWCRKWTKFQVFVNYSFKRENKDIDASWKSNTAQAVQHNNHFGIVPHQSNVSAHSGTSNVGQTEGLRLLYTPEDSWQDQGSVLPSFFFLFIWSLMVVLFVQSS